MTTLDLDRPSPLLGGLSPQRFMHRHWQRKPLCVRQAWSGGAPLSRTELFRLAGEEGVESRLVVQAPRRRGQRQADWSLSHGPLQRKSFPPLDQPGWTVLVQGVDLHLPAARTLMEAFRFVPDARLDDVMISWATEGGGVGPHVDAYDVFLIQVEGRRRWRIARHFDPSLVPGMPLRILSHFEAEEEWVLEPGDMLYLPPGWAHDGVAVGGPCMTCSVGFRTPARHDLVAEILTRLAEVQEEEPARHYTDPRQGATGTPAALPPALQAWAIGAVRRALASDEAIALALGEILSDPKPSVWFQPSEKDVLSPDQGVRLDARTRMLYDGRHIYVNGSSWRMGGRDARILRRLADRRGLTAAELRGASEDLRDWLRQAASDGWLHPEASPTKT